MSSEDAWRDIMARVLQHSDMDVREAALLALILDYRMHSEFPEILKKYAALYYTAGQERVIDAHRHAADNELLASWQYGGCQ